MKKLLKNALIGFGLVAVFIGAALAVFGGAEDLNTEIAKTSAIPIFESLPKTTPALNAANLTDDIANVLAKEIVSNNPTGPQRDETGRINIASPDPDRLVAQTISEGIKNFDLKKIRPTINPADLTITPATDQDSLSIYFQKFKLILEEDFQTTGLDQQNPEKSNFAVLLANLDRALNDFYKLPVPQALLSIHTKQMVALGAMKNIYTIIARSETDPVQAILVTQIAPQISLEAAAVLKEVDDYIAKNKLNI